MCDIADQTARWITFAGWMAALVILCFHWHLRSRYSDLKDERDRVKRLYRRTRDQLWDDMLSKLDDGK